MLLEFHDPSGAVILVDPTTIEAVTPYETTVVIGIDPVSLSTGASIYTRNRPEPINVRETTGEVRDRLAEHAQRLGLADATPIGPAVETGGLGFDTLTE
ncbi:hypothetical protein [Nocardia farcinica]|uniref:hypothetical protein n=1 Tax=Nocardia farcinica TaxID=37329 RepID=UPI002456BED1|nr:hypothetical protein [Nocardia farcinica]